MLYHRRKVPDTLQTIGPLCVEVVGLQQLQSLLSISWLAIVLPTLCKIPDLDGRTLSGLDTTIVIFTQRSIPFVVGVGH